MAHDGPFSPPDQPDQPHKKWDTGGNKSAIDVYGLIESIDHLIIWWFDEQIQPKCWT